MRAHLGVDIGGTNVKAALVAPDGGLLAFRSAPWSGGPPEDTVAAAEALRRDLSSAVPNSEVVSCGVGAAGLVDAERGLVRLSPNLPEWHDVELERLFAEALGLPTTVENDANAAAYAEYLLGAARGSANAVLLTLGTGVGGGIIIGGRLYRGAGSAGEIGHLTIDRDGEPCPCGNSGCLERYANARALVRAALARLEAGGESLLAGRDSSSLSAADVGRAAAAGDAVALAAVREVGTALGVGLAGLTLILDPDLFVLGGGVAEAGEPLFDAAREEMRRRIYGSSCSLPRLVRAELGETAGAVGAALLGRDRLGDPGRRARS